MRPGQSGYGGGLLGKSQGFGYLGGLDVNFTLVAVVTVTGDPVETDGTIDLFVAITAGGATQHLLTVDVTTSVPGGSVLNPPTNIDLDGWTQTIAWTPDGASQTYSARFTKATQTVGVTTLHFTHNISNSTTGTGTAFALTLRSTEHPDGTAVASDDFTIIAASTFDAVPLAITSPYDLSDNSFNLNFTVRVTVGVNNQTNAIFRIAVTDEYSGGNFTSIVTNTLNGFTQTLAWTLSSGVWRANFSRASIPVGTYDLTFTGAMTNSTDVFVSTRNSETGVQPASDQATNSGAQVMTQTVI